MTQDIKIKISNLTKIFGPKAESVIKHVDNGMGKDDLLKEHQHVLGLSNINPVSYTHLALPTILLV